MQSNGYFKEEAESDAGDIRAFV